MRSAIVWVIVTGALVVTGRGWAAPSPGRLAAVHARIEADCASCHDASGAVQASRCIVCHMSVADGGGLHASATVAARRCDDCHSDHRGPGGDISGWKAMGAPFDYELAGWRLPGSHADASCTTCHTKTDARGRVRYTGLVTACASCHQTPHGEQAVYARSCDGCHAANAKSWHATVFRHDVVSLGKHVKLACAACHPSTVWSAPADADCERCHLRTSPIAIRATTVSRHGVRFDGRACATCHPFKSWSASQMDHRTTGFPLQFKHAETKCRACHRGTTPDEFERLSPGSKCKSCHAHATVHSDADHPRGKYGDDKCLMCHSPAASHPRPNPIIEQAHGIAGTWPLVKGHKAVPCADCHVIAGARKTTFDVPPTSCASARCHEGDPHRGTLGATCTQCHVPGTWDALKFDHALPLPSGRTFPLRGDHAKVACEGCHVDRDFAAAPSTCIGCHKSDDAHRGTLGPACEGCHRDTGELVFDHARTRFPLDGNHREVACSDCHPQQGYRPRPTRCAGCHPVPAFHRQVRSELAWFDDDCGGCHSTRRW